jgi:DNA-binding transcriptional ArsR family regulator
MLTCPVRRRALGVVLEMQGACVTEVARAAGLERWNATRALRALQARGLVEARPQGRRVFYRPVANPGVRHAAEMLTAMAASLGEGESDAAIRQALTAYTHPRRIAIVRTLTAGPSDSARLSVACRISSPALRRHLAKLQRREVVEPCDEGYRLRRPPTRLGRALLAEATDPRSGVTG